MVFLSFLIDFFDMTFYFFIFSCQNNRAHPCKISKLQTIQILVLNVHCFGAGSVFVLGVCAFSGVLGLERVYGFFCSAAALGETLLCIATDQPSLLHVTTNYDRASLSLTRANTY